MTDGLFQFKGRAFVFEDDVDTDAIYPAPYLNLTDEKEIASHCMEEAFPGFASLVRQGDILIAGNNFGCGSAREHAPLALKGCGISCIIAKSFSRLFYRNATNIGLPAITADIVSFAREGDEVSVDCLTGSITLVSSGKIVFGAPLPEFMLEILRFGGLTGYLEDRLKAEGRL